MVPSWTETLIDAGVNVVGRTRFCIHPKTNIPIVGGTKDWNWEKIIDLRPDLLILDQEENPVMMSQQSEIPFLATHVTSLQDMPQELQKLSDRLKNQKLLSLSEEFKKILQKSARKDWKFPDPLPGLLQWGRVPEKPITKILYVIWQNPWMVVSAETYIGSILKYCGFEKYLSSFSEKYPRVILENDENAQSTLLLFSSEPYPFLKKQESLQSLKNPYAFINGESYSWFGVRSLQFLKGVHEKL